MKEPQSHPDFPELEKTILSYWKDNDIERKYLERNSDSDKSFRFLDGPITANNPMGVHHAHGRTIKDFYQRYYNMRGFKQRFQNGFDCQGLWVEVEEEKDLGFNSKSDIEEFGIDNFCRSCRARVDKFSGVQADQSKRLGMFMNWENSYYTMSERNNLHIWYFLKKVHEKGWLYKGVDAMPWCTRCGTAISAHELSDGGYKDVTHESIYVRFTLTEESRRVVGDYFNVQEGEISFLVWTTTPWTLLANTAVAVNPNLGYSLVKQGDEYLILATNRLLVLEGDYKVLQSVGGTELIQLCTTEPLYEHPFADLSMPKRSASLRMISWDDVTDTEGTGIVHIAPSAGKEDFELGKKLNLGFDQPSIDEFGNYNEGFGIFSGQNVFDVRSQIYNSLKDKGLFYKAEQIFHAYPHCWRCKHELVFRTTQEWFIDVTEIRPLMKKAAGDVNWLPKHAGKRMQDWLDNMGPWPISRKRYWGLALPFYENEEKTKFYVVESKEELKALALNPDKVDQLPELHRPWIDEIELDGTRIVIDGKAQSGVWRRVADVGDCWLDAGIVPFSTVDYLTNREYWKEWYPFDFITEYINQTKLWFYATLFMSVTLTGKAPWKTVLATGVLADEGGKPMHKSAGNAIDFNDAATKAGADAIRWLYLRERPANYHGTGYMRFGYTILNDVRRRFLVILWNSYRFIVSNALMDGWDLATEATVSENLLDQWIISRINSVLQTVNERLELFDSTIAAEEIESFVVQDFSQWYIRRSRDRVGINASEKDKSEFYTTSFNVLNTLMRIMAPYTPFITEAMYQNIRSGDAPESIHLLNWPSVTSDSINTKLEQQMRMAREIVERIHAARKEAGFKVRQPLAKATVLVPGNVATTPEIEELILNEVNVKQIELVDGEDTEITVELDTNLTPELKEEGFIRELIRQLQTVRRDAGYKINQMIDLNISTTDLKLLGTIEQYADEVKKRLIISQLTFNYLENGDMTKVVEVDGSKISVTVKAV